MEINLVGQSLKKISQQIKSILLDLGSFVTIAAFVGYNLVLILLGIQSRNSQEAMVAIQ
jgi:hypothetical protein